jgi:hypothetical protein
MFRPLSCIFKGFQVNNREKCVKVEHSICQPGQRNGLDDPEWDSVQAGHGGLTQPSARLVERVWNVMTHVQKPYFVFRLNGLVHLNRRGRQFTRLLASEVCASAVVVLDTPCSEVVWRLLAAHVICRFPLHLPSSASPCAGAFQLDSTGLISRVAALTARSHLAQRSRKE